MKRVFALALMLGLLALAGCKNSPSSTGTGGEGDGDGSGESKGVIGVSLLTLENPFFRVIGDNITSEAKKHGYEVIVVSADKDAAKQSNQVKDFIVKKAVAIVMSPCESRSIVPAVKEANEAGIPVFTVDIPCHEEGAEIVSQIATDNYGGGKEAAHAMIEALGAEGGKVAILHFQQAESCRLRVKGFREIIDEHNKKGEGKVDIVMELDGGGLKDQGDRAATDVLQAHADLRGIFAINDPSALGAYAALEKAGKTDQITIIGFDGMPEGKQAIKEGKIYADPIQFPDKMGVEIVQAFLKHSKGESVEPEVLIPTKLYKKADAEKDPELK